MSAIDNIYSALMPLGLYSLTGNTLIDSELASYNAGIAPLYEAVTALYEDMFIATAGQERLTRWERLLGLAIGENLSPEARRERLLSSLAVSGESFSHRGITESLRGVGIEAEITQESTGALKVVVTSFTGDYGNIYDITAAASKMMPSHLHFTIDTGGQDWEYFEETYDDWADFDNADLTWQAFDTMEE